MSFIRVFHFSISMHISHERPEKEREAMNSVTSFAVASQSARRRGRYQAQGIEVSATSVEG